MSAPREQVVRKLIEWASYAMEVGADRTEATPDEIISAHFTMTRHACMVLKEHGAKIDVLREGCYSILLELADDSIKH